MKATRSRITSALRGGTALSAAFLGILSVPAMAEDQADTGANQGGLADIIVTARRRAERAETAPLPITAIGGKDIEQRVLTRLSALADLAPNLKITQGSGSANAPVVFIRGIGTLSTTLYTEPAVALYVDGVYTPRATSAAFDLPDLERVEVLRGPQGTLFGRNTTGGAIMLVTQAPTDEPSAKISVGYGRYDDKMLSGVLQTGAIGQSDWRLKIAANWRNRDGWVRTPGLSKSDWGGNEKDLGLTTALAGSLGNLEIDNRFRYARNVSFTAWQAIGGTPAAVAAYTNSAAANPSGPPLVLSPKALDLSFRDPRVQGNAVIKSWGDTLTLTYPIAETAQLKSISNYAEIDQHLRNYLGGSYILGTVLNPRDPAQRVEPISVHAAPTNPGKQKQFSQEFQVAGDLADFEYVLGLYYWWEKVNENVTTVLNSPVGAAWIRLDRSVTYEQTTRSYAAFGEVKWKPASLDEKLEVTLGGRYTKDKRKIDTGIVQTTTTTTTTNQTGKNDWGNFGYSGSISYRWVPGFMTYGRIASSFRAGGFNALAPGSPGWDPEKAITYELGWKLTALNRHLRFDGNVFQIDYDNLQVNQFNSVTRTNFIVNAAKARYRGFELEGALLLGEHVQLDGNVGYVDPKYKEYNQIVGGVVTNVGSTAHFAYLSKWSTHVGAQVKTSPMPMGVATFRVDYSTKSSARLAVIDSLAPTLQGFRTGTQKELSARVILSDIPAGDNVKLTAQLFGENLTNNRYYSFATDFGSLATAIFNRPRTWGARLTAEF
ncbi:MAG: TonB-dependent receptor [Rhizorhabdus sp.]|uniref:TonB-dependent receptor n=1 Tax=Rhizorhabdus sp. TaxID=1968843 RepID=UPI001B49182F|nr:TonB-dependent receptor [Rhizorhabdus sp.]MBP8230718.1 TonB-dependent receptor [Rhizorhabdus sp.]